MPSASPKSTWQCEIRISALGIVCRQGLPMASAGWMCSTSNAASSTVKRPADTRLLAADGSWAQALLQRRAASGRLCRVVAGCRGCRFAVKDIPANELLTHIRAYSSCTRKEAYTPESGRGAEGDGPGRDDICSSAFALPSAAACNSCIGDGLYMETLPSAVYHYTCLS